MILEATIYTQPVAKARARVAVRNGHAIAYTPAKTKNSETEIRCLIREHTRGSIFGKGVPLALEAIFYIEKPASKPKRVKYPTTRPDIDNFLKTLLDALNGYVIPDDSQIVQITASKAYGTPARIYLKISEVE